MDDKQDSMSERIQRRRRKAAEAGAIATREEVIQSIRDSAIPVDYDELVRDGVLARFGKSRSWYEVLDWNRLPEHVSKRIRTMSTTSRSKNGVKDGATVWRFKADSSEKKAQKLLDKIEGRSSSRSHP